MSDMRGGEVPLICLYALIETVINVRFKETLIRIGILLHLSRLVVDKVVKSILE
jgi:hypothetical protein